MKNRPTELPGMQLAIENDFRTKEHSLKLNVEYREWMLGSFKWELKVTNEKTNIEWLKIKILGGFILIHETPVIWNQSKEKVQDLLNKIAMAL